MEELVPSRLPAPRQDRRCADRPGLSFRDQYPLGYPDLHGRGNERLMLSRFHRSLHVQEGDGGWCKEQEQDQQHCTGD